GRVADDLAARLHLAHELEPDALQLADRRQRLRRRNAHHEIGTLLLALPRTELRADQRFAQHTRGVAGDLARDAEQLAQVALVLAQQRADLIDARLVSFPLLVELPAVRLRAVAAGDH